METPSFYSELESSVLEEARRASRTGICVEKDLVEEGQEDAFSPLEGEKTRKSSEGIGKCESLVPPKPDISSEVFANKLFCAGDVGHLTESKAMEGHRKTLPGEVEMAFAQGNGVERDSYNSRFLLSVPVVNSRGKKKRRSRASIKAPIKVFSTDVSNFMAMVHELTGIPSHTFPLHSPAPPSKLLPFIQQGLPTLDTSTVLLPTRSCDLSSNGNSFSPMQALGSEHQLGFPYLDVKPLVHPGQLPAMIHSKSSSKFDLMRTMCSTTSSSLPSLWEASYMKQNIAANKAQQSRGDGGECMPGEGASSVLSLPMSGNITTSLEVLLSGHERLPRTDTWPSAMGTLVSNVAKKELT